MQDALPSPLTGTEPHPAMVLAPSIKEIVPLLGTGETVAVNVSAEFTAGDRLLATREMLVVGWAKLIVTEPDSAGISSDSSLKFSYP